MTRSTGSGRTATLDRGRRCVLPQHSNRSLGAVAWFGWIEYFFLVYGLGTFGYLVFTIVSLFRQEYLRQKLRDSGH